MVNCWGIGYRLVAEGDFCDRGERSSETRCGDQVRASLDGALRRTRRAHDEDGLQGAAAELVEEVLQTALALEEILTGLLADLPADAFPGQDNGQVLLEMIVGSVAPAAAAAGEDDCRVAIALVAAIRERVQADLRTAVRIAAEDRS